MRLLHMWSRKRLLKKEKKHRLRKTYLVGIIASGCLGLTLMALGVILILQEPLFASPIPLLKSWGESREKEQVKKEIEKGLNDKSIEFESITKESSDRYKISLKDNGQVFLNPKKGVTEQLSSLQVVLQQLTMEGKKFSRLDLTFDRPVIVLQ